MTKLSIILAAVTILAASACTTSEPAAPTTTDSANASTTTVVQTTSTTIDVQPTSTQPPNETGEGPSTPGENPENGNIDFIPLSGLQDGELLIFNDYSFPTYTVLNNDGSVLLRATYQNDETPVEWRVITIDAQGTLTQQDIHTGYYPLGGHSYIMGTAYKEQEIAYTVLTDTYETIEAELETGTHEPYYEVNSTHGTLATYTHVNGEIDLVGQKSNPDGSPGPYMLWTVTSSDYEDIEPYVTFEEQHIVTGIYTATPERTLWLATGTERDAEGVEISIVGTGTTILRTDPSRWQADQMQTIAAGDNMLVGVVRTAGGGNGEPVYQGIRYTTEETVLYDFEGFQGGMDWFQDSSQTKILYTNNTWVQVLNFEHENPRFEIWTSQDSITWAHHATFTRDHRIALNNIRAYNGRILILAGDETTLGGNRNWLEVYVSDIDG